MNSQILSKKLLEKLDDIDSHNDNILEKASRSIEVCRRLLSKYKKEVLKEKFPTINDEIEFFKKTKQVPLVKLIYFSEIHSFEIQFPKGDKDYQLKFIKKKMGKLNRFFLYNMDFGRYVDSGATHFDKEYYTRDYQETFHITTSKFYFQDPEFCTPRDMLLGKYKAYDSLITYLDQKKFNISNELNDKFNVIKPFEKMNWPFSNTDYVELLYALCSKGLGKQNNKSLMQTSKKLQRIFDFEPKDIYKTYQDIKNRKTSRTLFLDQLSASLLSEMEKSEE
ncbi:regulatory protein [Tenacibaculum holothuriorum]|uniref:Regulatory protein n=1 Tax=Tenacibaculum holothuriorum TaxID=1635173 RepID=A0A1Y2PAX2_9FLAO|nr:RteC domain-containing protein [Tenacibaculum holothuriorum]OSY87582.1 regulatory protein [Tenacibaculum holothuriorum]